SIWTPKPFLSPVGSWPPLRQLNPGPRHQTVGTRQGTRAPRHIRRGTFSRSRSREPRPRPLLVERGLHTLAARDLGVPVTTVLDEPFLRRVVDVDHAEAFRV